MKCALLCNGPSRVSYKGSEGYDHIIGCNVPWAFVHSTVIFDKEIINYYWKHPELIQFKIYFSRQAWRYTDSIKKRKLFIDHFGDILDPEYPFYSSGHGALSVLIKMGATEVDIYGCDSWFEYDLSSYTHQFANNAFADHKKCVDAWRNRWNNFIINNKQVKINFIR